MRNRMLALTVLATVLAVPAELWAGDEYAVDPVHSVVLAKIRHLNVSNFYARFNDVSGKVVVDEADPAKSSIEVVVKADSFDSNNEKRDQHVKNPDFLNAKQFPVITYKSTAIKKTGDDRYEVTGDLSLHGVTKPVTAAFTVVGRGKDPRGASIIGAETKFTFKRSDFDMSFMLQGLGDEIEVTVSIEAGKKE